MPGRHQTAGDRRPHRPGADKPDAHLPSLLSLRTNIIGASRQRGKTALGHRGGRAEWAAAAPIRRRGFGPRKQPTVAQSEKVSLHLQRICSQRSRKG
jgi:hypothetical protein